LFNSGLSVSGRRLPVAGGVGDPGAARFHITNRSRRRSVAQRIRCLNHRRGPGHPEKDLMNGNRNNRWAPQTNSRVAFRCCCRSNPTVRTRIAFPGCPCFTHENQFHGFHLMSTSLFIGCQRQVVIRPGVAEGCRVSCPFVGQNYGNMFG